MSFGIDVEEEKVKSELSRIYGNSPLAQDFFEYYAKVRAKQMFSTEIEHWNVPCVIIEVTVSLDVSSVCDCGGDKARTTHSDWCSKERK